MPVSQNRAFKDEDAMTSDSATAVASQQSVKAYVDASSPDPFATFQDYFEVGSTTDEDTTTIDGSGSLTYHGNELRLSTGSTNGNDTYWRAVDNGGVYWVQTGKLYQVEFVTGFWTDVATFTAWLIMSNSTSVPNTATTRHFGFTLDDESISATNADNTTQTKTDTTEDITHADHSLIHRWRADCTAGTDVKFYIDGTLKATHTTNLPTANQSYYPKVGLTAGDDASHGCSLHRILSVRTY